MGWFKKKKEEPKVTSGQMKTKLSVTGAKLGKKEAMLTHKMNQAREEARKALKAGDERTFKRASQRYAMLQKQVQAVQATGDMTATMQDTIEMQDSMKDIAEIGQDVGKYQDELMVDQKQMEESLTAIRTTMEKSEQSVDMMSATMDAISTTATSSDIQDELRAELMAEITVEHTEEEELEALEKKLKKEKA
jgi:hypothetical protein